MLRIRSSNGLLILALLTVGLVITTLTVQSTIYRVLLGLPFLLFTPGCVLILALYPRRDSIDGIERAGLSLGLSIIIVPLIGLLMNYTPWGIRLLSLVLAIALFIILLSVVAWLRLRRLPEAERFYIELRLPFKTADFKRGKAVAALLVCSILFTAVTVGYVLAKPKIEENFTEFYILGAGGKAMDYPAEIMSGSPAKVTAVISNYEGKPVSYRVEVWVDGTMDGSIKSNSLGDQQQWRGEVPFVPRRSGEQQIIEFKLFKSNDPGPYRTLHIWVDVR